MIPIWGVPHWYPFWGGGAGWARHFKGTGSITAAPELLGRNKQHPELLPELIHMKQGNHYTLPSHSANSCKAAVGRCVTTQLSPAPQEGTHVGSAPRSTSARSQRFQPGCTATEHEANAGSEPSMQTAPSHPAVLAEHQSNAGCRSHPELIPCSSRFPALLPGGGCTPQTLTASITKEKLFFIFWTNCHLPQLFQHRFFRVSLATSTSSNTDTPGQLCRGCTRLPLPPMRTVMLSQKPSQLSCSFWCNGLAGRAWTANKT